MVVSAETTIGPPQRLLINTIITYKQRTEMIDQPAGAGPDGQWQSVHESPSAAACTTSNLATVDLQQLKEHVAQCIDSSLQMVEQELKLILHSPHSVVAQLAQKASSMGGKRLRPMLVLLSAQAASQSKTHVCSIDQDLLNIAVSVELVHAASLIHDDVMDHAESRRHQPTIGAVEGTSAAILLGDYLFTKAYAAAASCRSTFPARRIAAAATQLCEGELRQQLSAGNWEISQNEYYDMLLQKTASLCAVSCRLGAWQAGADRQQQKALHRFGRYLGLAFQICDDWLDYWGTQQVGKTLGTDLAQRKPTLPLLYYLNACDDTQRRKALELLSNQDDPSQATVSQLIRASSAGERTLNTAKRLVLRAMDSLQCLPDSSAKSALQAVACFSIQRSS